ncbi:9565_t:CDS:2 [Dentiscutata heterogama]|uniref:9565_t:CDS:1 n=1 Tax=Dentiscutata heterogama TaxID=1316150 RepID=A0ACA9LEV3_9GLOM|nr:9565_t:CDS:2 [Dentiscutata heterogama]
MTNEYFNLINDTSIKQWESDSVCENLLLDFELGDEKDPISLPLGDLINLSWCLELIE